MYAEVPREPEDIIKLAREQGFFIDYTGSGHVRLKPPNGGKAVIWAKQSKDHRAAMNFRSQLMRAGLHPPAPLRGRQMPELAPPPLTATLGELTSPPQATDEAPAPPPPTITSSKLEESPVKKLNGHGQANGLDRRGRIRKVILAAVARVDAGGKGIKPGDIVAQVGAHFEHMHSAQIGVAMAGYVTTGWLTRVEKGRYALTEMGKASVRGEPITPKKRTYKEQFQPPKEEAAEVPTIPVPTIPSDEALRADLQYLDEALAHLAQVEKIIQKHRAIAEHFSQLKGLLAMVKQE